MPKKNQSPALELVRLVNCHEGHQRGYSRNNTYRAHHSAVLLAIRYGLRFDPDDFATMASEGLVTCIACSSTEHFYAVACGQEFRTFNKSACLSYEHWLKRRPFIIPDPTGRAGKRISIGHYFRWYGGKSWTWLACTSFSIDGLSFTACEYHDSKILRCKTCGSHANCERRRVKRRVKITHKMIAEFHAELRKATGGRRCPS